MSWGHLVAQLQLWVQLVMDGSWLPAIYTPHLLHTNRTALRYFGHIYVVTMNDFFLRIK